MRVCECIRYLRFDFSTLKYSAIRTACSPSPSQICANLCCYFTVRSGRSLEPSPDITLIGTISCTCSGTAFKKCVGFIIIFRFQGFGGRILDCQGFINSENDDEKAPKGALAVFRK